MQRLQLLLSEPLPELKALALQALGNLCSDAVDWASSLTKAVSREGSGGSSKK